VGDFANTTAWRRISASFAVDAFKKLTFPAGRGLTPTLTSYGNIACLHDRETLDKTPASREAGTWPPPCVLPRKAGEFAALPGAVTAWRCSFVATISSRCPSVIRMDNIFLTVAAV
jgi:hypothetical protein